MSQNTFPPIVIKVGGSFFSTLENKDSLFFSTLAKLQSLQRDVVIIHGGGEQVLARMNALGIKSERKNGLRVTPDEHMPIVCSVLAGELNKQLVATCVKYGINAVGISLADGNIANCIEHPDNIGAVGVPSPQSKVVLDALLKSKSIPVIASIGKDENGRLYNVNADHAAICVAQLLNTQLYFFADVKGVLNKHKQVIPVLDTNLCDELIDQGVITDGMIVKVKAAQNAANEIKQPVTIASWDDAEQILLHTQIDKPINQGTQVLPETEITRALT